MAASCSPKGKERQEGFVLTRESHFAEGSSELRSMWGRLAGKWVQLLSDRVLASQLAATPARKTRQQSTAELLGMAELCLLR